MAVLVILIAVNLKYDWFYLRTVLVALIIGGFGIGTNHLFSYFSLSSGSLGLVRLKIISLSLVDCGLENREFTNQEEVRRSRRRAALFHLQFF